jgi:hypothetical protein
MVWDAEMYKWNSAGSVAEFLGQSDVDKYDARCAMCHIYTLMQLQN